MHGTWSQEEDIFVVTLRLGTNFTWKQIRDAFNQRYKEATQKDLESRYNKTLKPQLPVPAGKRRIADVIDDHRHDATIDEAEQHLVEAAKQILAQFPEDRLW